MRDEVPLLLRKYCIDVELKLVCITHLGNLEIQVSVFYQECQEGDLAG